MFLPMDMTMQENADVFDPIPLQPLLRLRPSPERAIFEEHLRKKTIQLVTLIKPEIILYTICSDRGRSVYCIELSGRKAETYSKAAYIYKFRNPVIAILNLSYEHRVRVGFLLEDGAIVVSVVRQTHLPDRIQWTKSSQILGVNFDLANAHLMVYSRTADSLFWPSRSSQSQLEDEENDQANLWDLKMYCIRTQTQATILTGIPRFELEAVKDELVILFRQHGVLFIEYRRLAKSRPYRQIFSDSRNLNDSGISDDIEIGREDKLQAIHWSPELSSFKFIDNILNFEPELTKVQLRGHCHCKDQRQKHQEFQRRMLTKRMDEGVKRVIALYGDTVYKLTMTACTPLTTIKVPIDLLEPFNLMYLSRIVVLYNNHMIAGYMNSPGPVKVRKGEFILAGYGIIVNEEGIFRIKMSLPRIFDSEE